ncbi:hypothetical protein QBC34DRAFT_386559 [Podospora aff. communis PSN243]|uniref:Extracellular membrane protein CFEM domain-containing protein n=1 Tax=Podospora aff. communis PSN243 TaxID=3040156 RepID=A0AAV9G2G6_9PEZI|nr:hypothetical protein QBC34DRAFT_386559 [Podospora aff. communis PSN243]
MKVSFIVSLLALGLNAQAAVIDTAEADGPELVARQRGGPGGGRGGGGPGRGGGGPPGGWGGGNRGGGGGGPPWGQGRPPWAGGGQPQQPQQPQQPPQPPAPTRQPQPPQQSQQPSTPVCQWEGHCLGDRCNNENDCDHDWVCRNSVCARPAQTSTVWVTARPTSTQPRVSTVWLTVWGRGEPTPAA